jgi:hypothetical protein
MTSGFGCGQGPSSQPVENQLHGSVHDVPQVRNLIKWNLQKTAINKGQDGAHVFVYGLVIDLHESVHQTVGLRC